MSDHHRCVCEHESVRYCRACRVVYCQECKQEWVSRPYLLPQYPFSQFTVQPAIGIGSGPLMQQGNQQSATPVAASCAHERME